MPVMHIGVVLAVSFAGPEMAVKLISRFPSYEVPWAPDPDPGVPAPPTVKAYYRSSVPLPEYDPETEEKPDIPTEFISARYFMFGEKVCVVQNGTTYYIIGSMLPLFTNQKYTGREIEREDWASGMLDGSSAGPVDWYTSEAKTLLHSSGTVIDIEVPVAPDNYGEPIVRMIEGPLFFPNFNFPQSNIDGPLNQSYPVFVGPLPSIVNLSGWTWWRGAYNGIWSSFNLAPSLFSVLFPTENPAVRLEIQAAEPEPTEYEDRLPNLQFYVTPSDLGYEYSSAVRDFAGIDDLYKLVLTMARPWGTVSSNTYGWRTGNWTPSILFYPVVSGINYIIKFGFIDYKKDGYSPPPRDIYTNLYTKVTGQVSISVKSESENKSIFHVNDFDVSTSWSSSSFDSSYTLDIHDTGTDNPPVDGGFNQWVQTVTMQPAQQFLVCTDGEHEFKKQVELEWVDSRKTLYGTGGTISGYDDYLYIDLKVRHYVDSTLCFTSTFKVMYDALILDPGDPGSEVWEQRLYYLFHMDIANKLFIADVYVKNYATGVQRLERVVIDAGTEYVIWTYSPFSQQDGTLTNFPPWTLDTSFPQHPKDAGFVGDTNYSYTAKIWKVPFFNGLSFPLRTSDTGGSACVTGGSNPVAAVGVYYPCAPEDEDIHSVLLMDSTHFVNVTGAPGNSQYQQVREFAWIKKRRNGWLAFGRCCCKEDDGVIDYPYGYDIIKKVGGSVSAADELYGTPDEVVKTHF